MKKLALVFGLILMISFASAVELVGKTDFYSGETFQLKVSGNFLEPITKDKVNFFRGHVEIPLEYDVARIQDDYYIYALLPQNSGDYSVQIKEVNYMKGIYSSDEDIEFNFTISAGIAPFRVVPGFKLVKDDFYLEVQNLKDNSINVLLNIQAKSGDTSSDFFASLFNTKTTEPTSDLSQVILKSGETKKIYFSTSKLKEPSIKELKLYYGNFSYGIPIYIYATNNINEELPQRMEFSASQIDISLSTNEQKSGTIYLENTKNATLQNISFSLSGSLFGIANLSVYEIEELKQGEKLRIEIYFYSSEQGTFEGELRAKVNSGSTLNSYLPIKIKFIPDYVSTEGSSELIFEDEDTEGSSFSWLGWTIIVVVILGGSFFLYRKLKSKPKPLNLLKRAEEPEKRKRSKAVEDFLKRQKDSEN